MNNLKMYCICLDNNLLEVVKKLNYIPVGVGEENFSDMWLRDNTGKNISNKNKFYGEYSFHFWLWKNIIDNIPNNEWIGFCAYRRFWLNEKKDFFDNKKPFSNNVLQEIPKSWENYDVILGDHMNLTEIKWIKVIKYGKVAYIRNPLVIFKKKRNIRFQFDMFHGNGLLDKAIELLDDKNRNDFKKYVLESTSYNKGNMFITKSKEIMKQYYQDVFNWLEKCESEFGFDLTGYGKVRLYGFLAERFLPYWFNRYSKVLEWPIIFYDLRNQLNEK